MKKLAMLLITILLTSTAAFTFSPLYDDPPQFRLEKFTGSDKAGFDVEYSYPGEGRKVVKCTVDVEVTYSETSDKNPKKETFKMTRDVGSSGSGWGYFDGKSALDKTPLVDIQITSKSCS